jgi:hypothetical protein
VHDFSTRAPAAALATFALALAIAGSAPAAASGEPSAGPAATAAAGSAAVDPMARWEALDLARQRLVPQQLAGSDETELMLLRGLVFGRHGRVFKEREIQGWLASRSWYRPDPAFSNARLSAIERKNLDLVREAEARRHGNIVPGDLRWWQDRPITAEALGEHTAAEWKILAAEVEAIHGRRFPDEPWLQHYFDERYWYEGREDYDPGSLSAVERANLDALRSAQNAQRKVALSPGDLEHFADVPLTEAMLHGLTLYELRLLRNEVYARRGRMFRIAWLQQYFEEQPWYTAKDGDPYEVTLGPVEAANVATITAYENRRHEALATEPLAPESLDGLFVEEARKLRNEIYARHGRTFRDPWLAGYFASLAWYAPDPAYDDGRLTPLERRNVATLLAYEQGAASEADAVEG